MRAHQDNGEECSCDKNSNEYWHCMKGLNIETKKYEENQKNGLMICGINWGGDTDKPSTQNASPEDATFFSDIDKSYRYKNRIVNWFSRLEHHLERSKRHDGKFERSLVQTNWLDGKSKNVYGRNIQRELIENSSKFENRLKILRPKLIMFFSIRLLLALNSSKVICKVTDVLGIPKGERKIIKKTDVIVDGKPARKFQLGLQRFEYADVIAFPHPTGSRGISDDYIAAFKSDFSEIIAKYKNDRHFN